MPFSSTAPSPTKLTPTFPAILLVRQGTASEAYEETWVNSPNTSRDIEMFADGALSDLSSSLTAAGSSAPVPTQTTGSSTTGQSQGSHVPWFAFGFIAALVVMAILYFKLRGCIGNRMAPTARNVELGIVARKCELPVMSEEQFGMLCEVDNQGKEAQDSCAICLSGFGNPTSRPLFLPCSHSYHQDCIKTWLTTKSEKCPLCKDSVLAALGLKVEEPTAVSPSEQAPDTLGRPGHVQEHS